MAINQSTKPYLLELDVASWDELLDNAQKWLDNLLMTQSAFRQLAEDTKDKIEENHLKKYITEIYERAREHENQIEELYMLIERDSSKVRGLLGSLVGKARQVFADVLAIGGGVTGPWQDLHQLYLSNLNAIGSFAVAEQLGLALGNPAIAETCFKIVAEKHTDQVLLQECVLEMCVPAILYNTSF